MKPYDKNHPRNAIYLQCCKAAMTGNPLTLEALHNFDRWVAYPPLADGLYLIEVWDYKTLHIKPPEPVMVTRTVTYPAPMTVAPAIGTEYFALESSLVASYTWADDSVDQAALTQGRAFTTEADAQACWDALFGAQK